MHFFAFQQGKSMTVDLRNKNIVAMKEKDKNHKS